MALRQAIVQTNFDSVLRPAQPGQPAKLTIQLRVTLVPLDPLPTNPSVQHPAHLTKDMANVHRGPVRDYNKKNVACRSWLASEWDTFKTRFKQAVEHSWNNQLILLPTDSGVAGDELSDEDYRQLISDAKIQAHVEGALEITVVPINSTTSHALIEVAHLEKPGTKFRDQLHRISDESVQFARHTYNKKWPGWFTGQIAAAHEVGHWLRVDLSADKFPHTDWEYAQSLKRQGKKEWKQEQYGHTMGKREGLMGEGSVVTEYEALPWLIRIRRHTSLKLGWTPIHKIRFARVAHEVSERQKLLT